MVQREHQTPPWALLAAAAERQRVRMAADQRLMLQVDQTLAAAAAVAADQTRHLAAAVVAGVGVGGVADQRRPHLADQSR